ncbi:MCE family protein [Mycobacterium sp. DBP42]|uniref:MCE family protein n=1 Tax=Mycobacterium sp. DBP42 TaxID=2545267 RepID=UPI00110CBCD7|nr:MCE family protein [Mycobacterium sp. DBP42]TMS53037.1 MCE family protein [Mycobacterium sp. DBP42]
MKTFSERNPLVIGAAGIATTAGLVIGAMQYDKLPFLSAGESYSAYFAEAGGLASGAAVQVSGVQVGEVSGIELDGARVLVSFQVADDIRLGDRSEAAIKTKSLLGTKVLEVTPRGDGRLRDTIPLDRTISPYQLPDALGDLSATISGLDTTKVSDALSTLSETFHDTPPALSATLKGVARFSDTLNRRDESLRTLLDNAKKSTAVLAERSDQVVGLIANSNALLAELQGQSAALDQIATNISSLSQQLSAFVAENRTQLKPALDKVNGVLAIVDNRKDRVQKSIKLLNAYAMSLGESVSSGPFFKAYVSNLLPGQFLQPFIDAAFSDLGLDPNVLPPSELTDPPTGQPGIPAMPVPFPRTGQGGEPHLTLPDAITGNPGDPRYPYREPLPAPPPGGPPPGPPAPAPPGLESVPTPSGVHVSDPLPEAGR